MQYYKLTNGTSWKKCSDKFKDDYKHINLYDNNLNFIGIGLY